MNCKMMDLEYYILKDGSLNEFCMLLDCFDQILYFAMQKQEGKKYSIFSDDINLKFNIKNRNGNHVANLNVNKVFYNEDIFKSKLLQENIENIFKEIKGEIDEGKIIIVKTMIDMLPQYNDYEPDSIGVKEDHLFSIIGYYGDKFYFVDSPYMLKQDNIKKISDDKHIYVIEKATLCEAFKVFYNVWSLDVNFKEIQSYNSENKFNYLIETIVKNYKGNLKYTKKREKLGEYMGREALRQLLKYVEFESYENINKLFSNSFFSHLMMSRRTILKRCIKKYYYNINLDKILDESINLWGSLKIILYKNVCYPNKKIKKQVINVLEKIIISEEKLYKSLSTIFNRK